MGLHLELTLLNKWKRLICHTDNIGVCHSPLHADGGIVSLMMLKGQSLFILQKEELGLFVSAESHHDKQLKNESIFENYCDL